MNDDTKNTDTPVEFTAVGITNDEGWVFTAGDGP
jgi:hypothetical protein